MATSEAVIELTFKARNLAEGAVKELTGQVAGIAKTAATTASRVASAFAGMGSSLAVGLGSAVDSLSTGGSLSDALLTLGGFMAGELTENFAGTLLEKLAGSGLIAAITAPLAAIGTTIGGLISAAIPIGMALLPVILIAALVAAVAFLIANPQIVDKIVAFARDLVGHLIEALTGFLAQLPAVLGAAFAAAWKFVVDGLIPFLLQLVNLWMTLPLKLAGLGLEILHTIINGLAGLPGAVADVIGNAFRSLKLDIGPFHISGGGVTIDLPKIDVPHFATGAWNLPADTLAVVHRGEMIVPAGPAAAMRRGAGGPGAGGGAPVIVQLTMDGRVVAELVDQRLYYRRQRRPS